MNDIKYTIYIDKYEIEKNEYGYTISFRIVLENKYSKSYEWIYNSFNKENTNINETDFCNICVNDNQNFLNEHYEEIVETLNDNALAILIEN